MASLHMAWFETRRLGAAPHHEAPGNNNLILRSRALARRLEGWAAEFL
jgi:hypothetical protein